MNTNTEERILREIDELKWEDGQFACVKCGNKNYIKGAEPYSRRCSNGKCKREVTLKKYTAFEGVRFPIEKAYGILGTIVLRASPGLHDKIIPVKRDWGVETRDKQIFEEDKLRALETELISFLEYQKRATYTGTGKESLNEKLVELLKAHRPSIGRLSKEFEVEENTVIKFLDKIGNRITLDAMPELGSSLERIIEYISYHPKVTVSDLFGMAMVPLVGEWKYGELTIGGDLYGIRPLSKHGGPWSVFKRPPLDGTKGFCLDELEIRYGSDEWYALFHEIKDE